MVEIAISEEDTEVEVEIHQEEEVDNNPLISLNAKFVTDMVTWHLIAGIDMMIITKIQEIILRIELC